MAAAPHLELEHQKKLRNGILAFVHEQKRLNTVMHLNKIAFLCLGDSHLLIMEMIPAIQNHENSFFRQYVCEFLNVAGEVYMANNVCDLANKNETRKEWPVRDLFDVLVNNDRKKLKKLLNV
ncbi:MAG: hypothetical protein HYT93_03650 [Parcubacteria group bacterium]|nr:hypothetical protein [Parcubacteria group bacterium]